MQAVALGRVAAVLLGAAVVALYCLPAAAQAADAERGVLRAVGPHVSPQIVEFVAKNARPTQLPETVFPTAESTRPRRIIEKLCGKVSPAYVNVAAELNGLASLDLDTPLGPRANSFSWPACLYTVVPRSGTAKVTVEPGDTAYDLYRTLTGGDGSPPAVARFFGKSIAQLANIKPGQVLKVSSVSEPVSVVPNSLTVEAFTGYVLALDPSSTMVKSTTAAQGDIVMGSPGEGVIASFAACKPLLAPPFNPVHVKEAYTFAKQQADKRDDVYPGVVDVVVVDNGFFGARVKADGSDAFDGSSFKLRWFKSDATAGIASAIKSESPIWPINYSHDLAPDMTSGHGTHVAGLILGGAYFLDYRDTLSNRTWAQVTILNLGKGQRTLVNGASGYLHSFLANPVPRVVNLSISHDGAAKSTYTEIFDNAPQSLFVAAAGNSPRAPLLTRAYPAALGGPGRANIITVAALDGSGSLAEFSGRSSYAVDIAAPGCQLLSWIDNTTNTVPMSGTSQAAPLVTFDVSLLRSLNTRATPIMLKTRSIVSGDMLDVKDQGLTAFGVKLNIAKSLLWFDDYIEIGGPEQGRYLGQLNRMDPLQCTDNGVKEAKSMDDMWSVKRDGVGNLYYFSGYSQDRPVRPCLASAAAGANLSFRITHRIKDDGSVVDDPVRNIHPALSDLKDVVRRTQF